MKANAKTVLEKLVLAVANLCQVAELIAPNINSRSQIRWQNKKTPPLRMPSMLAQQGSWVGNFKLNGLANFIALNTTGANPSAHNRTRFGYNANAFNVGKKATLRFSGDFETDTAFLNGNTTGGVSTTSHRAFLTNITFSGHHWTFSNFGLGRIMSRPFRQDLRLSERTTLFFRIQ